MLGWLYGYMAKWLGGRVILAVLENLMATKPFYLEILLT